MKYTFKALLQKNGWIDNPTVEVDGNGTIVAIETNATQKGEVIDGYVIPGFQNAHSHAFQYAMAGKGEYHQKNKDSIGEGTNGDDFWSWRELMYELALTITPERLKEIAIELYVAMRENGYTQVAEFHYVHHDIDGKPYKNLAAMGEALMQAAEVAGIKITLIPIFYQKGGFGQEPNKKQRRFISETVADYKALLDASVEVAKKYEHADVAIGIHSMRGVEPKDIVRVATEFDQQLPFHIHISEQLKEVEDAITYLGKRPVEWLLDNVALTDRFHLVHATHLTEKETIALAKSGANVVLCPSTEGNLGDGIFPLKTYQDNGGRWSIGTDSHIGLNPFEEIRLLDYGQRLITHRRDTFGGYDYEDSGRYAIQQVTVAGRKAMNNFNADYFKIGADFDACIVAASEPTMQNCPTDNLASALIYTADKSMIKGVFVKGVYLER